MTHKDLYSAHERGTPEIRTIGGCSKCGETHDIMFFPWPDGPMNVGRMVINDHVGDPAYLIEAGFCENAGDIVGVYAVEGKWQCPPDCTLEVHKDNDDEGA